MRYVTTNELSRMLRSSLWKIPHDIDLVVGIPRSGLMVANMIALYLNKRLSDLDSFIDGRVFGIGTSRQHMMEYTTINKVLVVDDSVSSGASIKDAQQKLSPLSGKYEFIYFSTIVTSWSKDLVDGYVEVIDDTRIFEWNLFHHSLLEQSCVDIDGVLCCDPPMDDDGPIYIKYIENAVPLFIPTAKIGTIVTCRLEKYRPQTEAWLAKYKIKYDNLVMLDISDKASRVKWGKHGEYKAECCIKHGGNLFIESSIKQAKIIAKKTHLPVICMENNSLIRYENFMKRTIHIFKKHAPRLFKKIKRILKKSGKH